MTLTTVTFDISDCTKKNTIFYKNTLNFYYPKEQPLYLTDIYSVRKKMKIFFSYLKRGGANAYGRVDKRTDR